MEGKQIFLKTKSTEGIYVYAEIKNPKWYHKLGIVKKFVGLIEEEDYLIVNKKPSSIIIIPNSNEKYEYKIGYKTK